MAEAPTTVKTELSGLTLPHLEARFKEMGEKPFRARQVFEWANKKGVLDFKAMSNLPESLRESLDAAFVFSQLPTHRKQVSSRDGTMKFLFRLADGQLVESVFLPHEGRNTACLSTQVGCAMACAFCATGDSGFARHLQPGEIVGQIQAIEREAGEPLHNLVLMGMGEPFHNWENVKEALQCLMHPQGRHWGPRKITISTCGVVSGIDDLTASGMKARLAISLHGGNDETRSKIMPINRRYPLKELFRACRDYQKATELQLTFEYTVFAGVNDSEKDAREVVGLLRGLDAKVNLIPYNPVEGLPFQVPEFSSVLAFQEILRKAGFIAMIRTEKGGDIDAACGQLRRRDASELDAGGYGGADAASGKTPRPGRREL